MVCFAQIGLQAGDARRQLVDTALQCSRCLLGDGSATLEPLDGSGARHGLDAADIGAGGRLGERS